MRSINDYFLYVQSLCTPTAPVDIDVSKAHGLVLADDVRAALAVPPFSNSAMDGFLVNSADVQGSGPWTLPVSGDIAAGTDPIAVEAGTAQRIMTGAPVLDGTDVQVIPVEDTDIPPGPTALPDHITVNHANAAKRHIRKKGTNISVGDVVVTAGTVIDGGTTAALVSTGVSHVKVHPAPRIAVVSTGDEVVTPGQQLSTSQLPDSNLPMIAQLAGNNVTCAHSSDDPAEFSALLDQLSAGHDIIVTTGGISAGAFDVTKQASEKHDMWFGPINMKPGKPQGAGRWNDALLICLPGNPVAAWVSFHVFVAPAIAAIAGVSVAQNVNHRRRLSAIAGADFPASRPTNRNIVVPVRLGFDGDVVAKPYSGTTLGSHFAGSLAALDGYCVISQEEKLEAGERLTVYLTEK